MPSTFAYMLSHKKVRFELHFPELRHLSGKRGTARYIVPDISQVTDILLRR